MLYFISTFYAFTSIKTLWTHHKSVIFCSFQSPNITLLGCGNVDFFKDRVPLTSEFVKLNSDEEIVLDVTNCPSIKSLLEYVNGKSDNYKNGLSHKRSKYIDELVHVQFVMNKFCEKGLIEKLLVIFQSI